MTAVTGYILQPVREVALTPTAKLGNSMGCNVGQAIGIYAYLLQAFQPLQQTVHIGRIITDLEPARPDEPAHSSLYRIRQ